MPARSLMAIVTPAFGSPESVDALKREVNGAPTEVRMVAPAVEVNPLHHTPGDIDEPRERAGERLRRRSPRPADEILTNSDGAQEVDNACDRDLLLGGPSGTPVRAISARG